MSCPINKESLEKLKQFISVCKDNPDVLHLPDLSFLRNYIESLGGSIPQPTRMHPETPASEPSQPTETPEEIVDSDPESDLELDMTGCVEPDILDDNQKMGAADPSIEITDELADQADEKRQEGYEQLSEGNFEKALQMYTEAIELNPRSALLFAKRGQVYLKLSKPNACIRDCTKALELNCDSAAAYKFRGRAYRLLGEWELAAKDLRQACNIDYDEQTDEWLKEVTPNAKKIEQHNLKQERKKMEKEEQIKMERIRKAREAHKNAQENSAAANQDGEEHAANAGGIPGMGDFTKLLQDPEIMTAFQDPEVAAAFQDISMNPGNFIKYQANPKIMALLTKLSGKFAGSGMNLPGFPRGAPNFAAFGGGAADAPSAPPSSKPDDDLLD